jgi:hypothetical protein
MRVKAAHVRLCASRAVYVRVYPRESQEMRIPTMPPTDSEMIAPIIPR